MFDTPYNPYWWLAGPIPVKRRSNLCRLETFELPVNGANVTDESLDFGINPCTYAELPPRSLIVLEFSSIPAATATLPVTVVTPSGHTTNSTAGSASASKKVPVVDKDNNPITAGDITANTERLALLNKNTGTLRILESTATTAVAAE